MKISELDPLISGFTPTLDLVPVVHAGKTYSMRISDFQLSTEGSAFLPTTGGYLSGPLYLYAAPSDPLEAATKAYVDAHISTGGDFLPITGGDLEGPLHLSRDPLDTNEAVTKSYTDALFSDAAIGGVSVLEYNLRTVTTFADPGPGNMAFNNATQEEATMLFIDQVSGAGRDWTNLLLGLRVGQKISIQSIVDHNRVARFVVSGTALNQGGWTTVPVTPAGATGFPLGNNTNVAIAILGMNSDLWLPLEGGTLTGPLHITHPTDANIYVTATGSSWPGIKWNTETDGTAAGYFQSSRKGKSRWAVEFGSTEAEVTGTNQGTNFHIRPFNDDGTAQNLIFGLYRNDRHGYMDGAFTFGLGLKNALTITPGSNTANAAVISATGTAGISVTSALGLPVGSATSTSLHFGSLNTGLFGAVNQVLISVTGTARVTVGAASVAFTNVIRSGDGAAASPAYSFISETNSGLYRAGAGTLAMAISGTATVNWTATAMNLGVPLFLAGDPTLGPHAVRLQYLTANYLTTTQGDARWVNVTGDEMSGGLSFGSATVTIPGDFTRHITLHAAASYGIGVTPGRMNFNVNGGAFVFMRDFNDVLAIDSAGLTMGLNYDLKLNRAPTDPLHASTKAYADTKLALTGGTVIGYTTFNIGVTVGTPTSGQTFITVNQGPGAGSGFNFASSGQARWLFAMDHFLETGDPVTGSGGVGLALYAYYNGGGFRGTALSIARDTFHVQVAETIEVGRDPIGELEVATKRYADNIIEVSGGPFLPLSAGSEHALVGELYLPNVTPTENVMATPKFYVDNQDASLQLQINQLTQNLLFVGQINVPLDSTLFTAASGILPSPGPLPTPTEARKGYYVIVTEPGIPPPGSYIPAPPPGVVYTKHDWLICDGTVWVHLRLGLVYFTANQIAVLPLIISGAPTVQSTLEWLDANKVDLAGDEMTGGLSLGTQPVVNASDLSRHLAVYEGFGGITVSNDRLNIVATWGSIREVVGGVDIGWWDTLGLHMGLGEDILLSRNPIADLAAVPKQYVDATFNGYLKLSGGTMTGPLNTWSPDGIWPLSVSGNVAGVLPADMFGFAVGFNASGGRCEGSFTNAFPNAGVPGGFQWNQKIDGITVREIAYLNKTSDFFVCTVNLQDWTRVGVPSITFHQNMSSVEPAKNYGGAIGYGYTGQGDVSFFNTNDSSADATQSGFGWYQATNVARPVTLMTLHKSGGLNVVGGIRTNDNVVTLGHDLTKHINLYGGSYGLSVTGFTLNVVSAQIITFLTETAERGRFTAAGLTMGAGTDVILARDPSADMHAVSKLWVETNFITTVTGDARWVNVGGDTITGHLTVDNGIWNRGEFLFTQQNTGPMASVGGGYLTWNTDGAGDVAFVNGCNWVPAGFSWYNVLSPSGWKRTMFLAFDGVLSLSGAGIRYNVGGAGTNSMGFSWAGNTIRGWVDGTEVGVLATQYWVSQNSVTQAAGDTRWVNVGGDTMAGALNFNAVVASAFDFSKHITLFDGGANNVFGFNATWDGTYAHMNYVVTESTHTIHSFIVGSANIMDIGSTGVGITQTPTNTSAQLWLKPNSGNDGKSIIRFSGTFAAPQADQGPRYATSIRSGQSTTSWGGEYLDVWITDQVNDANSDARQTRAARFTLGNTIIDTPVTINRNLAVYAAGDPMHIVANSGNWGRYFSTVTGTRTWAAGTSYYGAYVISDENVPSVRFQIDTSGNAELSAGSLTILNGGLNLNNGVSGPQNASRGITFWGSPTGPNYSIVVSGSTLNYNVNNTTDMHDFYSGAVRRLRVSDTITASAPTTFNNDVTVNAQLHVHNLSAAKYLSIIPNLGGGAYNGLVQTGDHAFVVSAGAPDTGVLTLVPWSNSSLGIRIDGAAHTIQIDAVNGVTVNANTRINGNVFAGGWLEAGYNTSVTPPQGGSGIISWNRSQGGGEVNFYNTYGTGFDWRRVTGAGTEATIAALSTTSLALWNLGVSYNGLASGGNVVGFAWTGRLRAYVDGTNVGDMATTGDLGGYVTKTGANTMTGPLTVQGNLTVSPGSLSVSYDVTFGFNGAGYSAVYMNAAPNTNRITYYQTNGSTRWLYGTGAGAESGGDAGSDFFLSAYHDNGAAAWTSLYFSRATGLGTVAGDPTALLGIATKQYVDNKVASGDYVKKSGDDMSGALSVAGMITQRSASVGYTALEPGNAGSSGYLGVYSAAGTRRAYIGFADTTTLNIVVDAPLTTIGLGATTVSLSNNLSLNTGVVYRAYSTNVIGFGWDGTAGATNYYIDNTFQGTIASRGWVGTNYKPIGAYTPNQNVDTTSGPTFGTVMNTAGTFYVGGNTNYYLGRNAGDGTWFFVENTQWNFQVRADGLVESRAEAIIGGGGVKFARFGAANSFLFYHDGLGNVRGWVDNNAATDYLVGSWSDRRLKEDIEDSTFDCLAVVNKLPLKRYRWKKQPTDANRPDVRRDGDDAVVPVGLVAQDVGAVFPAGAYPGLKTTGGEGLWALNNQALIAALIGAVRQLTQQNAALGARVEQLEQRIH